MEETVIYQVLDILATMQEACQGLYDSAQQGDDTLFSRLYQDMREGLARFVQIAENDRKGKDLVAQKLSACGRSCLASLIQIYSYYGHRRDLCLHKIEFELLPLLQEAYLQLYFYGYLFGHPERLREYEAGKIYALCGNPYIDEAIQRGAYRYDLSIIVLAYNKLEYTQQCVESLLQNLPRDLRYELIFVDHGSSDGTREYFASKAPDKQLDIAVNGGGAGAVCRIVEGEFTLLVSNDVVVGPNAIEDLYACISSDPRIAWAVATTPNIANLQTIPASYHSLEEFNSFARRNNVRDPFRWEQRVRLCNPIDIKRSAVWYSSSGLCLNGRFHSVRANSFPDDRVSLLLRRNGYRMMLAKDAYCHHFGSVTLKREVQQQGGQDYYLEGRREFYRAYGVDPWGTGFCFARPFLERVVENESGHVDVLGINCGLGSGPLKIKEQLKEYCHNTDVTVCNITDTPQFLADLEGVSDTVRRVSDLTQAEAFLSQRRFRYIVWEDPFLTGEDPARLVSLVMRALTPGGRLFAKKGAQIVGTVQGQMTWRELGDEWSVLSTAQEVREG